MDNDLRCAFVMKEKGERKEDLPQAKPSRGKKKERKLGERT